jgi:hypothetical protein
MTVEVDTGATLQPGIPRRLFSTGLGDVLMDQYAATADGGRFLVLAPAVTAPSQITVILNWTAGLEK